MTISTRISVLLIVILQMIAVSPAFAFDPVLIDSVEVTGGVTVSKETPPPFWMEANRDGRISRESGNSFFTRLRLLKNADRAKNFDWMYGIDVTSRTNASSDLVWTDGYAGVAWKKLRLNVGRKSEFFGLTDSLLSAGPEVYSRNAPTIPKIALSTNGYVNITDNLAFNAYLAHGWMGEEQYIADAYLHQKFLYLRYGSAAPDRGVNLYFGFHHLAVWGGTSRTTGFSNPAKFSDFKTVFFGQKGDSRSVVNEQLNALGNHLGSIEYALQLKSAARDWLFYASTLFEDGSGTKWLGLVKPGDYLLGASLINKPADCRFKRINVEYFYTCGPIFNQREHDNYFNGGIYPSGWTHEGYGIGHPFISFTEGTDYAFNAQNRIQGANGAVALAFSDLWNPIVRVAWIRQLGSFSEPHPGIDRYAFALGNTSTISAGWRLNQELFFDAGASMKPNAGMLFSVTRSFL
jgi:hypothetical protein